MIVTQELERMSEVVEIQKMLSDNVALSDYMEAIMLCLECQRRAETMLEYTSMAEIAKGLREIRVVIGSQLEKVQQNLAR